MQKRRHQYIWSAYTGTCFIAMKSSPFYRLIHFDEFSATPKYRQLDSEDDSGKYVTAGAHSVSPKFAIVAINTVRHQASLMLYKDFISLFKQQVYSLSYDEGLNLAIAVCKRLYFDYEEFVSIENWGDKDLLMDAILLCEQTKIHVANNTQIEEMLSKVNAITPDTDDFGNYNGSYALNAAASVYETLQFILDRDILHIYNIGTYLTDTVDFKIDEKEGLPDEQTDRHPMMIETRNFLIEQTKECRAASSSTNNKKGVKWNFKKLFGFGK